jgi:hypothetical protein
MTNSCPLGNLQVQVESEMEALETVGSEMVALVSEEVAMAEPVGLEPVACNMSGRATCHHPEDNGSRWQGQLPNIWHMRLFLF